MDWSGGQPVPQAEVLRGDEMRTPDEVAAMLRLKALGWGIKRIAGGGPVRAVSPPGRAAPCAGRS